MSSQNNKGRFSTTKFGQWFKATPLVPLTDAECYEKIYGSLVLFVEHYKMKIDTHPGALNYMPTYLRKHYFIPGDQLC